MTKGTGNPPARYTAPDAWRKTLPAEDNTEREYVDKRPLPALPSALFSLDEQDRGILLALYGEVCAGWRTLTDIRFKLLGLLPVTSLAVLIALSAAAHGTTPISAVERTGIGVIGLLLTGAVRLYDLRNTMLYNDLIGRGREIEAELGIHTGMFRGRPRRTRFVHHDLAIRAVYLLSALTWLGVAVAPWM